MPPRPTGQKSPVLLAYTQRLDDTFHLPADTVPPEADEKGESEREAYLLDRVLRAYVPTALLVAVTVAEEHGLDAARLRMTALQFCTEPNRATLTELYEALKDLRMHARDVRPLGAALRAIELAWEILIDRRTTAGTAGVVVFYASMTGIEAELDPQPFVDVVLSDLREAARIGGAPC